MEPLTMCRFDFAGMFPDQHMHYPFTERDVFVYLGDIRQMPGHCVVVRMSDNVVFTAYHTENFVELTEDEV